MTELESAITELDRRREALDDAVPDHNLSAWLAVRMYERHSLAEVNRWLDYARIGRWNEDTKKYDKEPFSVVLMRIAASVKPITKMRKLLVRATPFRDPSERDKLSEMVDAISAAESLVESLALAGTDQDMVAAAYALTETAQLQKNGLSRYQQFRMEESEYQDRGGADAGSRHS